MKKVLLLIAVLFLLSESVARAVVFTGAMDNRTSFPFVPGFTAHSRAWVTGGHVGAGLRLEWQADNETVPGSWTYTYRVIRNTEALKGFGFFDIETASDFTAVNIIDRQVVAAFDGSGTPLLNAADIITISDPVNFVEVHDFSNAAVTEANAVTVLDKFDLSHYSGDPGRVPAGAPGGPASATPSAGPVPHPFFGIRVTFPGSFATLVDLGYFVSAWEFRIVTDRVPMWGDVFGWGDQTILSPFWYSDLFNNHIDDTDRLTLAPVGSLTGADPYQGWVLVPGPLPSVISAVPAAGATGVPVTEPVTAVFSGLMDPTTITAATFTLNNGALPVAGTVIYDEAAKTAVFTPDNDLLPNTVYTATISTGAVDLAGNALSEPSIWTFTTSGQDAAPPTVAAKLPGDGAAFIAVDTSISITFSELIDQGTLSPDTFSLTAGTVPVPGNVAFNPATRTATFTPNDPLANNTAYTVTVSNGIEDLAGNPMTAADVWSFTTIPVETVLPFVAAQVPAPRSSNIQINTPITATFSEQMDPATINDATFTVAGLTGTVSYNPATLTAIFTPDVPLEFSTTYRPSLSTAVSDPAGNRLPLVNSWSFTTAAPDNTPPSVTGVSPADGSNNVSTTTTLSASFSEQVDSATVGPATISLTGRTFSSIPPVTVTGTVTLLSSSFTLPSVQFTPGAPLPMGTVFTATVTGVSDPAGNVMPDRTWSFVTMPDGILTPGATSSTVADALRALRIAVNLVAATQDDRNHGDVAPLGADGRPRPNGTIDIADALVILRKAVGLVSW